MSDPVIRIAAKGDGLTQGGRHVVGAVPGDTVAPDGSITPGPHHVDPPCRHFPQCGGCQLQMADEAALAQFVGEATVSRATLTSKMWSYFKSNNLMDPENKRWVIADDTLKALLGVDRFQGFTVSKYLSDHLLPME